MQGAIPSRPTGNRRQYGARSNESARASCIWPNAHEEDDDDTRDDDSVHGIALDAPPNSPNISDKRPTEADTDAGASLAAR